MPKNVQGIGIMIIFVLLLTTKLTTMYKEVEVHSIDRRKGGYYVNFTHSLSVDGDGEDKFIEAEALREHVKTNELNVWQDFPSHGDLTTLDLNTWLEDNETEAIKHYLTYNN